MSTPIEVDELFRALDLRSPERRGDGARLVPMAPRIVPHEGKLYKVRWFATEAIAERQWQVLQHAREFFPVCRGRVGQYLVFEHLDGSHPERSPEFLERLGGFLGELAAIDGHGALEDPFEAWCQQLEAFGIFQPRTVEMIRRSYLQRRPPAVRWGLAYLEGLTKNLVVTADGRLRACDEKHLVYSPRHLSLSKLMIHYSPDECEIVRIGYTRQVDAEEFDDPRYREFLLLTWTVASLIKYTSVLPKWEFVQKGRFHRRRRRVLDLVGTSKVAVWREEVPWRVLKRGYHAATRVYAARRKLRALKNISL